MRVPFAHVQQLSLLDARGRRREGARREGCSELGSGDAGLEAARDPTEDDLAGRSPDGALEAQLATDDQWPDAGPPMGSSVAGAVALVRPSRGHGMGVHVAGGRCDVRPASRRLASTLPARPAPPRRLGCASTYRQLCLTALTTCFCVSAVSAATPR